MEFNYCVNGFFCGIKVDIYEVGYYVFFLVCWLGEIDVGLSCNELICFIDCYVMFVELIGVEIELG